MLERNPWLRALVILTVLAVAFHLIGLLWDLTLRFGDVIMVFVLAWIIAFALRPLAKSLHAGQRVPWALAVATVYVLFFALAVALGLLLIPPLVAQLTALAVVIPVWLQGLVHWYTEVQSFLPEQLQYANIANIVSTRDLVAQAQQLASSALQNALVLATGVASAMLGLVIVLVISFYLTLDGERITAGTVRAIPIGYRNEARFLLESVERSFGGFLRGQLIQALVYSAGTAIIMSVAGLGYIVLSAVIAAVMMIIPFVGPIFAIIIPIGLAAGQGGITLAVEVFIALFVLQQIVFNVLAPKVMSDAVGLHPLLVLLAILAGSRAAGLAGAIFGVPVLAVLVAMVGFFYQRATLQTQPSADATASRTPVVSAPSAGTLRELWNEFARRERRRRP